MRKQILTSAFKVCFKIPEVLPQGLTRGQSSRLLTLWKEPRALRGLSRHYIISTQWLSLGFSLLTRTGARRAASRGGRGRDGYLPRVYFTEALPLRRAPGLALYEQRPAGPRAPGSFPVTAAFATARHPTPPSAWPAGRPRGSPRG